MNNIFEAIAIGVGAFLASNIDDLLILMAFFANKYFPITHVIVGQYVGMGSLIAVSLLGSLVALVVPPNLIGLVGLFPIAIGIKELLELQKKSNRKELVEQQISKSRWIAVLPFITVATVTFSGGEEIGIYASIFATNNEVSEMVTIIAVSMALTAFWCGIANYLVNHSFLADRFRAISTKVLPFILIGLGIYVLTETFPLI